MYVYPDETGEFKSAHRLLRGNGAAGGHDYSYERDHSWLSVSSRISLREGSIRLSGEPAAIDGRAWLC
jgi:hypothetical protein